MPLKKIDSRIRTLVENGVALHHRSLFVVVGDHGRDQVVILHHMLSKAVIKARPSVLWCYKKELGFSSHRKKRMKQLQKKLKSGSLMVKEDDAFELFIAATDIRYCYYSETHKILGNTYGMCILQDFEALTPNLMARTMETVEGGGLVVILLRTMQSLRQLCTMTMDVHARYRTEAHQHVVARFNERFLLSLSDCTQCIVLDDQLHVLPISSHVLSLLPVAPKAEKEGKSSSQIELDALKDGLADTQVVGQLVNCSRTLDQAKALLKIVEAISEPTIRSTVAMTASRGRGKSATLGLAIAAAIAFGYSNVVVTSPSPENLRTLFEFLLKGFDSVEYREHEHYEVIQSTNPDFNQAVIRVNVFQHHKQSEVFQQLRQTVKYVHPSEAHKVEDADLVCIDEAAAIPLPLVKKLMGAVIVLMASTINGYEGTGRSLSLKLIEGLRCQSARGGAGGRVLREILLEEPIRYAPGDPVEVWLHKLLCLDSAHSPRSLGGCPSPQDCSLYYVNRDTLFCYHKASEAFLQQIMALYVSSHYKNSPNDLQLLSDAPAHHIFVLLGPVALDSTNVPQVLCVLQVSLEGAISKKSVMNSLSRGKRASGDLIPWTLSQQFADHDFAGLSGVRVVRIATHADFQGMGYGSRAMQLLMDYYSGKMCGAGDEDNVLNQKEASAVTGDLLHEVIAPRTSLPPLLAELSERKVEALDYVGVSFGLTADLLRFWSQKNGFVPVYLRQTANELTGEHSCIMLRPLSPDTTWLDLYYTDFRCRYMSLLGYQFRLFPPPLALGLLRGNGVVGVASGGKQDSILCQFSKYDLKRLEQYTRNMADYHLITDLLPAMAKLYFTSAVSFKLDQLQSAILLGLGLQHKTVEDLHSELGKDVSQLLGHFNRIMHKFMKVFKSVEESKIADTLPEVSNPAARMLPVSESLVNELSSGAREIEQQQVLEKEQLLQTASLAQYAVSGPEDEWAEVGGAKIVSIKKTSSANSSNTMSSSRKRQAHIMNNPLPKTISQKKRRKK